jgi:RNA polymerase sigma factor (sigma-70 family)
MEASALRYSGGIGVHGRSPLLRLQSDERLILMVRRGSTAAFEILVSRYHARLLAFCRHLLGSREDAEDVLQEVLAAAFNAILADDRPINVRPWLYRIARNRCLNHLRKTVAVGVDSMDVHLFEHGASTADKVHGREEFRLLVEDIRKLPETQRTALVLREMDALSYEQIAEAMETTVPSIKSLLVRARVSLAEAAEARMLSCEQVRVELAEVSEGLQKKSGPLVRRHLRTCKRCSVFNSQLKRTNKALTALLPIGPLALLRKLAITHVGHSAGASSGAGAAAPAAAIGSSAAAGSTAMLGTSGGIVSLSVGTIATKAAATLAAAALGAVTVGAVAANHGMRRHHQAAPAPQGTGTPAAAEATVAGVIASPAAVIRVTSPAAARSVKQTHKHRTHVTKKVEVKVAAASTLKRSQTATPDTKRPATGRTQSQTVGTVLPTPTVPGTPPTTNAAAPTSTTPTTPTTTTTGPSTTTTPTSSTPSTTTTPTSTTNTPPSTTAAPSSPPAEIAPFHERRGDRHRRHRRERER